MLFQLVLTKFLKNEMFLRLPKVDHVIKSCKEPSEYYLLKMEAKPVQSMRLHFFYSAVKMNLKLDYCNTLWIF